MILQKMKNDELEVNLKDLVCQERELLHSILLHIQQIEIRRIYLERGYPTLFQYLVNELAYSASAAMRRIEAARLLKELPALAKPLESGDLNLSQIGEISRGIKEKQKACGIKIELKQKQELIESILGQSVRETQRIVAKTLDIDLKEPETIKPQKDDSIHLSLTFTQEQYRKLLACKDTFASLIFQNHNDINWASVIEHLADKAMSSDVKSKTAVERRSQASKKRQNNNQVMAVQESLQEPLQEPISPLISKIKPLGEALPSREETIPEISLPTSVPKRANKTLTPKIKEIILKRDQCCQYKDSQTQRQCKSTFNPEIDHIQPRWAGGDNSLANLRVLCRQHNQYRYQRETGIRAR